MIFMTNKETLKYFELSCDLCNEYFRYQKFVQFLIHHFNDFTNIFMRCKLNEIQFLNEFFQIIDWFIYRQRLSVDFLKAFKLISDSCEACNILINWCQQKWKAIEFCNARQRSLKRKRTNHDMIFVFNNH